MIDDNNFCSSNLLLIILCTSQRSSFTVDTVKRTISNSAFIKYAIIKSGIKVSNRQNSDLWKE